MTCVNGYPTISLQGKSVTITLLPFAERVKSQLQSRILLQRVLLHQ